MNNEKIKQILEDLYKIDKSLKNEEKNLIKIINKLIQSKPNINIDENFVNNLKEKLIKQETKSFSFTNLTIMNKFTYALSGAVLSALIIIPSMYVLNNKNLKSILPEQEKLSSWEIKKLDNNAFGKLLASNENQATSGVVNNNLAEKLSSSHQATRDSAGLGAGEDMAISSKMIMPPFDLINYNFVYEGEEIKDIPSQSTVYKKTNKAFSLNVDNLKLDNNLIDLKKIKNSGIEQISILENKEFGYSFYLDYKNNTVSINTNWEKWPDPYKDCRDDQCYESKRLTKNDLLAEEKAIEIANNFLNTYGVDLSNYADAKIDSNSIRISQEAETDYLPEDIEIVYPLLVENNLVYSDNGNFEGIRVTVSHRHKKVSNAYGISINNFESSSYENVADSQKIIDLAKTGGMYNQYRYKDAKKEVDIKLNTPYLGLIKYWRFNENNNQNEEILISALIFPVKEKPKDAYFYQDNIIVPLTKEIFDEKIKERENINNQDNENTTPLLIKDEMMR